MKTVFRVAVLVFAATLAACSSEESPPSNTTITQPAAHRGVGDSFLAAAEWRFVGPFRGGRVLAVAGSTDDPLVHYFGAAHGGVWKTTDAGQHWRNVSDDYLNFPAIGALDVSLSNPDVIYAGTGEGLQRQYISPGDGVYKSTDAGETWTHVGLQDTRHISRLRVHPTNPDIVYVAAMGDMFGPNPERGVYRTSDGGETWEKILYRGETTGSVDLDIDRKNPDVILAAMNHHVTYPWDEESGGPTSGLFRSTDAGDTWTDITRNPGMPTEMLGKIGIAISPADSSRIYTFIEADAGLGGIYRSDDAGATWQMTHQDLYQLEIPNSYNHITADPLDPDVVYIQPISGFQKSTDAGVTFEYMSNLNWDHHALWIDPEDSRRMINGGDGGAEVTLNGGESWSSLENQPTADLLSLAVDDREPYWIYSAQNDNSHIAIPSQTDDPSIGWTHYRPLPVGEAGHTAVQPDGGVVYANDRSRMFRIDQQTGQNPDISVWPEVEFGSAVKDVQYRFYYTFPVHLSSHDGALYTAAQFVFKSTDEGQTWQKISPDLTRNVREVMQEESGGPISSNASSLFHVSVIRIIAESPLQQGELWAGTDDSTVQYSRDGGGTWQDVSPPDLPEWTTVTSIEVSRHQAGTVYISGERHRVSDRTPYIYKTTDYGKTWQRITQGIEANDYSWVVREDTVRKGLLYAGTETGAHVSFDDGENWQSLQRNLPPVIVMNMVVKDDDLVIATHGRGIWIMDNISVLRSITPEIASSSAHLFDIVPTVRRLRGGRGWTEIKSRNVAQNPARGVVIDYYLAEKPTAEVAITIVDGNSETIRRYSSKADEPGGPGANTGTNRFVWNMQYPGVELPLSAGALPDFESSDHSPPRRPVAPPGQYVARLGVDGQEFERPFQILKDPGTPASEADLQAQFDLMLDIQRRVSDVTEVVMKIREFRAEVVSRGDGLPEDSRADVDAILEDLEEIEGTLTIWMGSVAHPMMFGPPGIIQKLSRLSGAVISGDAKPTAAMYGVFDDLTRRFEDESERLNQMLDQLESR